MELELPITLFTFTLLKTLHLFDHSSKRVHAKRDDINKQFKLIKAFLNLSLSKDINLIEPLATKFEH